MVGKYVVVRTYSAGVHCGTLVSQNGKEVLLSNTRRIWSWEGAFTLSAVASSGPKSGNFSCIIPEIFLTEAIEIIPVSNEAVNKLTSFSERKI